MNQELQRKFKLAALEKRFLNLILDSIFGIIVTVILIVIISIISMVLNPWFYELLTNNKIVFYTVGFIFGYLYYFVLEYNTGRTLAKYITKTKVVSHDDVTPTKEQIHLRTLSRYIPFESYSYLFLGEIGWHDKFSKTKVVDLNKENSELTSLRNN